MVFIITGLKIHLRDTTDADINEPKKQCTQEENEVLTQDVMTDGDRGVRVVLFILVALAVFV